MTKESLTPATAWRARFSFAWPATFAAMRHRNFQLYFGGQLISVAGTWMQIIAQGWLVYELSHSEWILGLVGFASAIPALLITPWGGVVVDRVPKRTVLIATQIAAMVLALILALLTLNGRAEVWHVVALAAGLGVVNAFDGPARQAFVVEMVGRADLTNAIALNSMMFNSARVIGPAFAGILLALLGPAWCFFINAVSFLAVIIGLWAMRFPPAPARPTSSSTAQFTEGLRYVFEHPTLLALILLALIFSTFGISYMAILPAFVSEVLHADASTYGALNAASGLGAVLSAYLIARYGNAGQRGQWLTAASMAFPILLILFATTSFVPFSLVLSFGLGVAFMVQFALINTLLQVHVADELRGRVLSLYTITFFGVGPFGQLALGQLAEQWGLSPMLALSALVSLVLSLIVFGLVPHVRRLA